MKNIVIAIFTSLLLFGASAGTSMYLNQPPEETAEAETEPAKLDLPPDNPFPEPPIKDMANQMPVAVRPDQALTIEAVRQMSESAEKRQRQLDEYAEDLKKEEQRIQMLLVEMKNEKMELTAFSEGVEDKINALDQKTIQLNELIAKIESEKKDLKSLERKTGVETKKTDALSAKVNEIKGWLEGIDPETAARVLSQQADSGEIELAAELLHSLDQRQKAKILEAIDDPALINQLIDSVKVRQKQGSK